ncbi:ribosome silencing factor [bacterium]|nr:MAG: ribosome silencing factor [bacterium]
MRAPTLAKRIAELTLSKKAQDVVIMDLRGLTSIADFFVVCSADSDPQVRAIADAVEEGMDKKGSVPWHRESGSANWVLLDYVDVVLHVFHKNTRPFYNLEKLWGDAVFEHVSDEKPAPAKTRSRTARPAAKAKPRRRIAS